jgi:chaperonin GroEL (HSP60 family)
LSAECEVISEELGLKLENTAVTQLGTAKTVKVDKDNTTIIKGSNRRTSKTASRRSRSRSKEV